DIVELSPGIYNESVLLDKLVHLRAASSPPAENPPPVVIKGIDGAPAVSISGAAYKGGSLRGLTLASDEGPTNAPMETLPDGAHEGGKKGTGEEEAGAARQCVVLCSGGLAAGEGEQFEIHGCRVEGGEASAAGVHIIGAEVHVALTNTTVKNTGGWGILCAGGGVAIISDCELLENARGGCRVEADGHVTLEQTRVCGNAVGVDIEGAAALTDCVVVANTEDGIVLRGECNPTVESTEVSGNGRNGVAVCGHARGHFAGCDIWENTGAGIAVAEWGSSMFRNTKVHGNGESGVVVLEQGQGSFEDCEVSGNKQRGVCIEGSGKPNVTNTKVHSNELCGIAVLEQGQGSFEGCEVYENKRHGICILGSGNPSLTNTKVHSNERCGIMVLEQGQGSFEGCELLENARGGCRVEADGHVTLEQTRVCGNAVGVDIEGTAALTDCAVVANTEDGIVLRGECNPTVESTEVSGNGRNGVAVFGHARGHFASCDIWENTGAGIAVAEWGSSMFRNTKVRGNGESGVVVLEQGQGSFEDCEVSGNKQRGVCILGSGNPSVTNTKVHSNEMCGIAVLEQGQGAFEGCEVYENKQRGVEIKGSGKPNVTNSKVYSNEMSGIVVGEQGQGSFEGCAQQPVVWNNGVEQGQGSFEGCEVYENKQRGVEIKGSGKPNVTNSKVYSNEMSGIVVGEQGQGSFEGCEVYENKRQGVEIQGSGKPNVTNSKVHSNERCGIVVRGKGQGSFEGCEVYENKLQGIGICGCGKPNVTNTKVHSNEMSGIMVLQQGQGSVEGCEVYENKRHGIDITTSGNLNMTNTKVYGNRLCGVLVQDDGAGTLKDCDINRNGDHGVHLKSRATLNVTGGHVSENTACGLIWDDEAGGTVTSTTVHGNREHGLHLRGASCPVVRQAVLYRNGGAPVVVQEGARGRFEECGEMGGAALTLRALLRRAGEAKARWRQLQHLGPEVLQEAHQGVPGSPAVALAQVDTQLRALDRTVREIEEHMAASTPELSTLSALQEQRRTLAAEIAATLAEACRELPERVRMAEEAAERMTAAAESHRAQQLLADVAEGAGGQQEEARGSEAEAQWRPCNVVEAAGDAAAEERTRCVMAMQSELSALCGPLPDGTGAGETGKSSPGTRERAALEAGEREVELWEAAARAELAQLGPRAQAALQLAVHQRALLAHYTARLPSLQTLPAREGKCRQLVKELEELELKQQELKLKEVELQHLENPVRKRRKLLLACESGASQLRDRGGEAEELMTQKRALRRQHYALQLSLRQQVALLPEFMEDAGLFGGSEKGLWVSRTVDGDYEGVRVLVEDARREVLQASFIGGPLPHPCVLKRFAVGDGGARHAAEKEVSILARLRHPLVVHIEAVFHDATPPSARPRETHTMARAVFQAVAYIHGAQVLHRDIKPSNILVRDDGRPQLADFDVSRDIRTGDRTATTAAGSLQKGTLGYMAPEVEAGGEATQASDCWSAGAVLYWLHFGEVPAPHRSGSVLVPPAADDALRELLEALLQQEPSRRPSAAEALVSAYMMQGAGGSEGAPGPASQRQVVALHAHVRQVQRGVRGQLPLHLVRHPRAGQAASRVLDPMDVLRFFKEVDLSKLRRGLVVSFHGEEGVDVAGLTTEMYTQFWEEVVRPGVGLFERGERGGVLPVRDSTEGGAAAENLPELLRAAGRAMAKCIYDRRLVRADFAPSLYKFLTGSAPSRNDLDHFNPEYGRQMTLLLITPGHAGHLEFETLDNEEALSEQNKVQYVREKVSEMLVRCRRGGLEAFRDGFREAIQALQLHEHVVNLGWRDVKLLAEGEDHISATDLKQALVFTGYPDGCNMEARLGAVLDLMEEGELRQFLYAVTGFHHFPAGGLMNPNEQISPSRWFYNTR
ncbi:hypothetical protein CYMTET_27502, partial [Cymbomonas tetramitiformis]